MVVQILLAFTAILIGLYLYWRFIYFFRDPERTISEEKDSIVSPADGTIIYIKKITDGQAAYATKKGRTIKLSDFLINNNFSKSGLLIGIFMHPTSVHVNRAPIEGTVQAVDYKKGTNLPMTITWWRTNLGMKPYEKYAQHIFQNERNIISIKGKIKIFIVQIADIYVNRIESWVKPGDFVEKGQRVGMIKMGSQVDVYIPETAGLQINAKVGDKVLAGESILGTLGRG